MSHFVWVSTISIDLNEVDSGLVDEATTAEGVADMLGFQPGVLQVSYYEQHDGLLSLSVHGVNYASVDEAITEVVGNQDEPIIPLVVD